jgi:hypothetical protein
MARGEILEGWHFLNKTSKEAEKDRAVRKSSTGPGKADTQAVTLRVPRDVYEAMRTHAFATDTTINEMATRAIYNYLIEDGREQEVDAFLEKARKQYRGALDKLAGRDP